MQRLFFLILMGLCHHLVSVPIITSISPTHGEVDGGTVVTIHGSGFLGTTQVAFGPNTATSFTIIDDSTISASAPVGVPGTVDIRITSAGQSPVSRNDFYTYTAIGWRGILSVVATNQVALFNTTTNTFDKSFFISDTSLASVMTPNGAYIYTANEFSPGFSVINVATDAITTVATSVGDGAFDTVINPSGTRTYISNYDSGYVTVVDTITNQVVTDIFVQPGLGPLSITPDGATLYVSCFFSGEVIPIDTATNMLGVPIPTGVFPGKISITPNGKTAFIPVYLDVVLVMDVATQQIRGSITLPAGSGPYGSSLLPNGKTLYVVNLAANTVSVIDVASEALEETLGLPLLLATVPPTRGLPVSNSSSGDFWAAATPDSKTVYVISETSDFITPIDTATNTVGTPFEVITGSLDDLTISPDPAPVAVFTATAQVAGAATAFDASSSLSPIGTIASYAWDFGDGTTLVTPSALTQHTYAFPGNYTVSLTVTNSAGTSLAKVFSSGFMSQNGGETAFVSQVIQSGQAPPNCLRGIQLKNQFLTQIDVINTLSWSAPLFGQTPAFYQIYRDTLTSPIGVVDGRGPFVFKDHNRVENRIYTYHVVAVNASGFRSAPVSVSIGSFH